MAESRTLYISRDKQEARSKETLKMLLTKGTELDKVDALWQVVKEMGMGVNHQDLLLTLTMFIPKAKDKRLIALFYLFMEGVSIEDEQGNLKDEILMVCNMIRSHLNHPNEHVRTKAIRLVSRFRNPSIFDALKTPLAENIGHTNHFVRLAAYLALRALMGRRETAVVFEDVFSGMKEGIVSERDPICLAEGYKIIEEIDKDAALSIYHAMKDTSNEELKMCFLNSAERLQDVERIAEMSTREESRSIGLEASVLLIKLGASEEHVKLAVDNLLEMSNEYLDAGSKLKIVRACEDARKRGRCTFEGVGLKLAKFLSASTARVNILLSREILAFVLKILVIIEAKDLFSYLLRQFNESATKEVGGVSGDKIFFLSALKEMVCLYKIQDPEFTEAVVDLLGSNLPELALEAVEYLDSLLSLEAQSPKDVLTQIISKIDAIKYGKILRKVLGLIKKHADKDIALLVVTAMFDALSSKKESVLGGLEAKELESSKIFPGVTIASFLLGMCKYLDYCRDSEEKNKLRVEIISTAMKVCAIGKKSGSLDESSRVALLKVAKFLSSSTYARDLSSTAHAQSSDPEETRPRPQALSARPLFSLIRETESTKKPSRVEAFAQKQTAASLSKIRSVFQLSSIVDPLYCECTITCNRTEIVLDILLVNQTDTYLENVEFDIVTSSNIKVIAIPSISAIREHSAQTLTATLIMEESDAGYIGGIITAGRIGRDDFFSQNLQEIRFELTDMLKEKSIEKDAFKDRWGVLLWENFYTLSLNGHRHTLNQIAEAITEVTKGTVIDTRTREKGAIRASNGKDPEILVKNIFTTTSQGADLFINAMLHKTETGVVASFRIRGEKCRVVKSLCHLVSKTLKALAART
ncbi:coatomer, subunit beta [Nematocida displodere]|uniref:Coatomer, subunit beta n=1 Tax=Nematocida displodere TaxID=1805483 RepID=A0A177EGK3_9MICR|nr:coatomer, subunit beta [Nematocida displodere]